MAALGLGVLVLLLIGSSGLSMRSTLYNQKGLSSRNNAPVRSFKSDWRKYRHIVLPNGLEALLVSDHRTETAGASVDVNVGSWSDPDEYPGLAHLTEHMVFLSSKTYPKLNSFDTIVAQCSGSLNAFTAAEHTNYYFEGLPECLEDALDHFAHLFIDPTLSVDQIEHEIAAVNSEYEKDIMLDAWKIQMVLASVTNPKIPMHRFTAGNTDTLLHNGSKQTHRALVRFFKEHYFAQNFKLVVHGPQSLTELEKLVKTSFKDVKSGKLKKDKPGVVKDVFVKSSIGKVLQVESHDDESIALVWNIPPQHGRYLENSMGFISSVISSTDPGSLTDLIRRNGWGYSVSGSFVQQSKNFDVFGIDIRVSNLGLQNTAKLLGAVQSFLEFITEHSAQEWRYHELNTLNVLNYETYTLQSISTMDLVQTLSGRMWTCELIDVMTCSVSMTSFNSEHINSLLSILQVDKAVVVSTSAKFFDDENLDKIEPIFHTKYRQVSMHIKSDDTHHFKLSSHNSHIPLEIEALRPPRFMHTSEYSSALASPVLLSPPGSTDHIKTWFKFHGTITPTGAIFVLLRLHSSIVSLEDQALGLIYCGFVQDHLNDEFFDYLNAGYSIDLSCSKSKWSLSVSGFHSGLRDLASLATKEIFRVGLLERQPWRVLLIQRSVIEGLETSMFSPPHQRSRMLRSILLNTHSISDDLLLEKINEADIQSIDLSNFGKRVLNPGAGVSVEVFCYGNVDLQMCRDFSRDFERGQKFIPVEISPWDPAIELVERVVQLSDSPLVLYESHPNPVESNIAISRFYQLDTSKYDFYKGHAMLLVISQLLNSQCYSQLRSIDKLGYIVRCDSVIHRGGHSSSAMGYEIIVQSSLPAAHVSERMHLFIETQLKKIKDLSDKEFDQLVSLNLENLKILPKSMQDMASFWWSEIVSEEYMFYRKQLLRSIMKKLTKDEFVDFFALLFGHGVLEVRVYGCGGEKVSEHDCPSMDSDDMSNKLPFIPESIQGIRDSLPLLPLPPKSLAPLRHAP